MSKKNNNADIRIIQFSNYVRPKIKENDYMNWVMNGKNNEFYQYIIDRYNGSPTNASVCNTYADLIFGKGLSIHNSDKEPTILQYFKGRYDLRNICSDKQIFNAFAVQIIKTRGGKLDQIVFLPKHLVIPSVENEDGEIEGYWYSRDWTDQWETKNKPKYYPAFGMGEDNEPEIYVGKEYTQGCTYFETPDYMSALQAAEVEEEISNFTINYIQNGLSLGNIITIPNSAHWDEEIKKKYEKAYKDKASGSSNANKTTIVFASGTETTEIASINNAEAHNQWESLRSSARQEILTAHRCTSPSIVGVVSSSGFSNTADEMQTAREELMKYVIAPKQMPIIDALKEISGYFNLPDEDIYFRPLTEIEGEEEEENKVDSTVVEEEEKVEMNALSCDCKKKSPLDDFIDLGEVIDDNEFDLIDEIEVDYEEEEQLSKKLEFASTGTARPNAKSSQDGEDFIVRYVYTGKTNLNPKNDRNFCIKMMQANKVYRKEDIIQLDNKAVNPGWGPNGVDTYSIWLYKGGGSCRHKWNRRIYLKKGKNVDVNSPLAEIISTSEARRRGYKLETNDSKVSIIPNNMPNNGFLNPR